MEYDTTGPDSATGRDGATRQDATGQEVSLTVAEVATALGLSAGAVRKRLERGQLAGHKVEGQWRIRLPATDVTGTPDTTRRDATRRDNVIDAPVSGGGTRHDNTTGHDATRRDDASPPSGAMITAARSQLAIIGDELLQPLIAQITEQAETIGRLRAERDRAAREAEGEREHRQRDADQADQMVTLLEQRVWDLEAERRQPPAMVDQVAPDLPPLPEVARRALRRLLGRSR